MKKKTIISVLLFATIPVLYFLFTAGLKNEEKKVSAITLTAILFLLALNSLTAQQSWYQINTGFPITFYSVHFMNQNTGIACSDGNVARTTNGGLAWELFSTGFPNKITDIKMTGKKKAIAVCDGGLIIKTSNGGINWFSVHQSVSVRMMNLVFTDSLHGYAVARETDDNNDGYLYRTLDGGDNWNSSFVDGPYYISFGSTSRGWIHTHVSFPPPFSYSQQKIESSFDSGNTWSVIYTSTFWEKIAGPIFFVETTGYKVVQQPAGTVFIARSVSGGNTWVNIDTAYTKVNSMYFVNSSTGWLVCDNGKILFTSSGSSFVEQQSSVSSKLNSVFFVNDSVGWIATSGGIILKTTTGGTTALQNAVNMMPEKFSLKQNYPNPFNPVTVISYELIFNSYVELKVFDIKGREIKELIKNRQNAGRYSVEFDASNLTSGVYFYKIEVIDKKKNQVFTETKKMLLLK